jgi:beta-galactosidase/beta-glucuronidase
MTTDVTNVPRPEYPRPRFVRDRWLSLNGTWEFAFDPEDRGIVDGPRFDHEIVVPFAPEWALSGIGDRGCHTVAWYRRTFEVPAEWQDDRVWLRFGAVDYSCQVWVNDALVATHEGGHTPFGCDITKALLADGNVLVVRCADRWNDVTIPRGKQTWMEEPFSIFYTRTTGIWQTVWLEPVPDPHVVDVHVSSDGPRVQFDIELSADAGVEVAVAGLTVSGTGRSSVAEAVLDDVPRWSPSDPHLVDAEIRCGADRVRTYVGLRDIRIEGSRVYLNEQPLVQRLVLDQGYWPDGGLTAPTDDALQDDVAWVKALGFDGVRKHQKVEDPRWLYHCDRSGVLVWSEMANAYAFTAESQRRLGSEWQEVVRRDRSHPCVVTWVPINESWGIPEVRTDSRQQAFARSLYHLTKSLDATRPVVDNDGWEHTDDTDLLTIHDYAQTGQELEREWSDGLPTGLFKPPLADGVTYRGQPVLVTEYGGIAYIPPGGGVPEGSWGYGETESSGDAFVGRYRDLTEALRRDQRLAGWCYTQLTDVEQETNGLLTFDRRPKVDPRTIAAINRPTS